MALVITAFLAISAAQASAEIIVNLAGPGTGTIESDKTGNGDNKIECSNLGGPAGPRCSESFPTFDPSFEPNAIALTATPGSGYFRGWTGDNPILTGCNKGSANPCTTIDLADFSFPPIHITATFDCSSFAVATNSSSAGADSSLRTLEGTVDANECGVDQSYFEYGPTAKYGSTTPTEPSASELSGGSGSALVTAETDFLEANTTYHYRLVVSSLGGASYGEDHTFTTGPAVPGACPNEARRLEQGVKALRLPDCMALEMVSPPQKSGFPARFPAVSADGGRVSFLSAAAIDEPSAMPFGGGIYVASRGGSGWNSETTVPHLDPPLYAFWSSLDILSFTPDLSHWFGFGATVQQAQQGIGRAYEAGLGGFFRPLSQSLVPRSIADAEFVRSSRIQGASADHSHLYFKAGQQATYLPGDPPFSSAAGAEPANVYLARSGAGEKPASLELLQRDRNGKVWGGACRARLGGIGAFSTSPNGERNQGAVSADGSRTYLSARAAQPAGGDCESSNKLRILQRLETPTGPQIVPLFASECSRPSPDECSSVDGNDLYQGASLDQSKVYFTTNRQLANSDIDGSSEECSVLEAVAGCDLYLYDSARPSGERLVQVSAGEELGPGIHEAGKEADVFNGITAISADGSHVYFVAAGVLTEDENPAGDSAQAGQPNLYLWDPASEETTFLGTLAAPLGPDPGDSSSEGSGLWGGNGTSTNNAYPVPVLSAPEQGGVRGEEGGDGHILVFQSKAELTPDDGDGRHLDAYRYDADAEMLECLSCTPGSSALEPDVAPFDVKDRGEGERTLGTDFAENHRWVSEDGQEVAFMTPQRLLPGDVNDAESFYLWRQGVLVRLPGNPFLLSARDPGAFLSHDGSTVAFTTATPLLPQDGDASADVYVARVGGGFPNSPAPTICEPGNPSKPCQERHPEPPAPPTTSEAAGSGNPPPRRPCSKGKVRRHGRCVPRHRRHAKKRHSTRQTDTDRRAAK